MNADTDAADPTKASSPRFFPSVSTRVSQATFSVKKLGDSVANGLRQRGDVRREHAAHAHATLAQDRAVEVHVALEAFHRVGAVWTR